MVEANQFNKTFPRTYCVPGPVLGPGDTDTEKVLPTKLTAQRGRQIGKETSTEQSEQC